MSDKSNEHQVEILNQPDELTDEDLDDVAGGACAKGTVCDTGDIESRSPSISN